MTLENFLKITGRNIANFRKSRKFNQREAAEKSGLSYRYFQEIESGRANITFGTLYRVAKFLNVHVCDLLPTRRDS